MVPPNLFIYLTKHSTYATIKQMYSALKDVFPDASVRELLISAQPGWNCFNPSIAKGPEGTKIIVRSTNYVLDKEGRYGVRDPAGAIRTRNFLGTLDCALQLVDLQEIRPCSWGEVQYPLVRGLEDARLYWAGDSWKVYGTLREHRWDGIPKIVGATLDHDQLVDPVIYEGPDPGRCEKNWMIIGKGPHFIYSCNPPATIHHGVYKSEWCQPLADESREFRGGSQAIPLWKNQYLAIIHEVDWSTGHRRYFHRFCSFDSKGDLTGYTVPFFIAFHELLDNEPMIEYAAGLIDNGESYCVSLGFKDARCFLASFPKTQVHQALRPARTA